MASPFRFCLLLMFLAFGLAGCQQYTDLPTADEPVSIALLPVVNQSELPQVIAPLARNVREKLAHSPNWRLTSEEEAEVLLKVTVLGLRKRAMARDPEDTGRPLSYHEEVQVAVEWISELPSPWGQETQTIVRGDQILYAQPSRVDAQSSALPALADRLADKVIQALDWAKFVPSS